MSESVRGATIIRAFNQEATFKSKENKMVDDKTRNIFNHHSCWCWFNLRMTWASQMIPLLAIVMAVLNKGKVSNIVLCLLINRSLTLGWFPMLMGQFNHFQRMMIQVQRVFNL